MTTKRKTTTKKKPAGWADGGLIYEVSFGGIGGGSCRRIDQDLIEEMTERAETELEEAAEQERRGKAVACAKRIEKFAGEELRRLKAGLPSQEDERKGVEEKRRAQQSEADERKDQSQRDKVADRDRKIETAQAQHKAALLAADAGAYYAERLNAAVARKDWKTVRQITADMNEWSTNAAKKIKDAAPNLDTFKSDTLYRRTRATLGEQTPDDMFPWTVTIRT